MAYTRTNWVDDSEPPIDAAHLNKIEQGVADAHTALEGIDTTVAWDEVLNKPQTFPSTWDEVSGKPETFPPSAHSHHNYQALLETNLDLLMRGILYTRAQPFSQSFTFSGDGSRTAFKIPRSSVNQQGWVRGGVTATVDAAAAAGTWDIHTQTYTLSAAPANGASVVISSTDVVPYQGMGGTARDTLRLIYTPTSLAITTSGTGVATNRNHPYFPASVKLPLGGYDTREDALLHDTPQTAGLFSFTSLMYLLTGTRVLDSSFNQPIATGTDVTPTTNTNGTFRKGSLGFYQSWHGQTLSSSYPHIIYMPLLFRIVTPASGSAFSLGELVLGVVSRYDNSSLSSAEAFPNNGACSFDLFRLNGGPVIEP